MNLPNKLTLVRIAMIPVFVVLASIANIGCQVAALAVFAAACFTDFLDGNIARKNNLVTNFGKFADPIADKLLVTSAYVVLVGQGRMPAWVCIIFLAREFIISGFRLVASGSGTVIAAAMLGKIKTVTQMISSILLILLAPFGGMEPLLGTFGVVVANIAMYIALVMTVWSGADYIWKGREFLKDM
jgi:CDP-diacylglycerol--glycerol-3-phosphate 3-phosphatidyltransferase